MELSRKSRNIVLIGMPGAGKSTIGVLLAKTLGMSFIDTDLIIQEREGRLLQDIISLYGISRFLDIEENAILSLNCKATVVATGGSVVYSVKAMRYLRHNATVIYLKVEYDEIERRITNISTRGIAMNKGQNLIDIYNERIPLYERYADIVIDCSGKDVEDIIQEIAGIIHTSYPNMGSSGTTQRRFGFNEKS
ncbi:MAG: shikimate kinase [Clostridiaceae bacterium]|nr:shikimate kinase [Clostridiaceae bacterium]